MSNKLNLLLDCDFETLNVEVQREVYFEFYKMAYGQILYMVSDHGATEDIIQESFLKVIRHIPPDMNNESSLKAWLRVVIKNSAYNFLRKHKNIRNEVDADGVLMYDNADYSTHPHDIQNEIELKMMSESITSYLDELKPEYKVIVELRWHQDLSYREIADCLDITEQGVKYKLYRAREAIKKKFLRDWGKVK